MTRLPCARACSLASILFATIKTDTFFDIDSLIV